MTDPVDLLAIGAHPDDVEIGCGGTLIRSVRAHRRVAVADLTLGEKGTRGSAEERDRERTRAAEILGLCERPCLHLPDAAVGSSPDHLSAIVQLLRRLRPQVVLAPFVEDRHPDHATAGQLVQKACFLAGLAKIDGLPPHRPTHLFQYMLHHQFTPKFIIDVTSVWSVKMDAVLAYKSQVDSPGEESPLAGFLSVVDARSIVLGALIGAERGEGFTGPGPVPLRELPGLDGGGAAPRRRYNANL